MRVDWRRWRRALGRIDAVEAGCWALAVILLVAAVAIVARGALYQRVQGARLDARLAQPGRAAARIPVKHGDVIGRLEVPRLGLSVIVAEGDDTGTLSVAAGHLSDSPLPWDDGNSVVAAHRDSYFRPLQRIRHGDVVRLTTIRGVLLYKVVDASIVEPDDLSVMDPTPNASLTLITCYPFSFVGTAPQRFIVRAERVNEGAAGKGPLVSPDRETGGPRSRPAAARAPSARR
jgi:LPXTG-site transpeptidase (sortase) family protein